MSGWKRENGVFVLVLARFRGLEGVRILTISVFFSSLLFKRHPEGIFWRFLRFLAPFGLSLGGNFATFFRFFEQVKKNMIFERSPLPRRLGRRPQDSLRERLGPCAEVCSRRLRQAKAWRGVSTGFAPAAGPATICWLAGLLVRWLGLELIWKVFWVSGAGFW